jgi:hypothetical protein
MFPVFFSQVGHKYTKKIVDLCQRDPNWTQLLRISGSFKRKPNIAIQTTASF